MANIKLKTYDNNTITAYDDAIIYDYFAKNHSGILNNIEITIKSTNTIHIQKVEGIIKGRAFAIPTQDIAITPDNEKHSLIVKLQLNNQSKPIDLYVSDYTEVVNQEDDVNYTNGIYELVLCDIETNNDKITKLSIRDVKLLGYDVEYTKEVLNSDFDQWYEAWKFSDGSMIQSYSCYHSDGLIAWGSLFSTNAHGGMKWKYPFVTPPSLSVSGISNSGALMTTFDSLKGIDIKTNFPEYFAYRATNITPLNWTVKITAIGRWK